MKKLIALGLALVASLVVVAGALALAGAPSVQENVEPTEETGNIHSCPAGTQYQLNLDYDAGEVTVGDHGFIRITRVDGKFFDWEIIDPDAVEENVVYVKGGPNTNKFDYTDPPIDTDSDTYLHAPRNLNGGGPQPKYYGLSHILFCFDPKD